MELRLPLELFMGFQAPCQTVCGICRFFQTMHGGVSDPSLCVFIHRVAFEEGSGPRVLLKSDQEGGDAGLAVGSGLQGGNQLSLPATSLVGHPLKTPGLQPRAGLPGVWKVDPALWPCSPEPGDLQGSRGDNFNVHLSLGTSSVGQRSQKPPLP